VRSDDPRLGHDGSGDISGSEVADIPVNIDEQIRNGTWDVLHPQHEQGKPDTEESSEADVDTPLDALAVGPGRCRPPPHRHAC